MDRFVFSNSLRAVSEGWCILLHSLLSSLSLLWSHSVSSSFFGWCISRRRACWPRPPLCARALQFELWIHHCCSLFVTTSNPFWVIGLVGIGPSQDGRRQPLAYFLPFGRFWALQFLACSVGMLSSLWLYGAFYLFGFFTRYCWGMVWRYFVTSWWPTARDRVSGASRVMLGFLWVFIATWCIMHSCFILVWWASARHRMAVASHLDTCWYLVGCSVFLFVANSIGMLSALQVFFWRRRWGIVLLIIIPLLVCARHATSLDIRWASASHRTAVASLNGLGAGCKGSSVQRLE